MKQPTQTKQQKREQRRSQNARRRARKLLHSKLAVLPAGTPVNVAELVQADFGGAPSRPVRQALVAWGVLEGDCIADPDGHCVACNCHVWTASTTRALLVDPSVQAFICDGCRIGTSRDRVEALAQVAARAADVSEAMISFASAGIGLDICQVVGTRAKFLQEAALEAERSEEQAMLAKEQAQLDKLEKMLDSVFEGCDCDWDCSDWAYEGHGIYTIKLYIYSGLFAGFLTGKLRDLRRGIKEILAEIDFAKESDLCCPRCKENNWDRGQLRGDREWLCGCGTRFIPVGSTRSGYPVSFLGEDAWQNGTCQGF